MRTTLRIDDDLILELRARAERERTSLTRLVNRVIRNGLKPTTEKQEKVRKYREKSYSMGRPAFNLDKALALAAALEDEEALRKMALRK